MNKKVFLIGMMGAGKTSIGLALSKIVEMSFLDVDQLIDSDNFILKNGIEKFRKIEEKEILKIDNFNKDLIVSIGGGAILSSLNQEIIKKNYCVYLEASIRTLIDRVSKQDVFRPLIQSKRNGQVNIDTFTDLFNDRVKIYHDIADLVINTNNQTIADSAQIIKERLIKNEIIN